MNEQKRELLLDSMSYLWAVSRRAEDYWQYVGSLEQEEAFSYYSSLLKYPTQLGSLFGQLSREENSKIYNTLQTMILRPSFVKPSFFEASLWAAIIDVKSQTMRREFFRIAWAVDSYSRRMLGSASEMTTIELDHYLDLARKYISLSKHIHPAFSHSERVDAPIKKESFTG